MPLQNRVTPWGEIVATEARGLLMGNRGCLHDRARRIVRYAVGRRWIACVTSFKGRRRVPMTPGLYTELFFLDEAVAFAAGHRPCAECRRPDYLRFQAAWMRAVGGGTSADEMDGRLHADRLAEPAARRQPAVKAPPARRTFEARGDSLPDGAMVDVGGRALLVWRGALYPWTPAGYAEPIALAPGSATVITPESLVEILRAGYKPLVHPTANPK